MTPREIPTDLLTLPEAARFAERSEPTIRRWVRSGAITRYDGTAPPGGGSLPILVSRQELQTYLVTTNQRPITDASSPALRPAAGGEVLASVQPVVTGDQAITLAVLTERLSSMDERIRMNTALADARAQVIVAERDAALDRVARLTTELAELRRDRDDWRDRHDAVTAELAAVRSLTGQPWWRKLLPSV